MKKVYAFLAAAVLFSSVAFSQDMFLRIDGIEGEVSRVGHEKQIEVLAYSQGLSSCLPNSNGSGGSNACKVSISPLNVMIRFDRSNIALKNAMLNGTVIPALDFYLKKTGGDGVSYNYYQVRMENVTIVSAQESNSAGSGVGPSLAVEISSTRIAWIYRYQKPDGQISTAGTTGWDVAGNKAWSYVF